MAGTVIDDKELYSALKNVLDIVEMEQERNYVSNSTLFDHLLATYGSQMKTSLIPTGVSKNYAGLHLGELYEDSDFDLLIKSFVNNQILDAFYAIKIIRDANNLFKTMPNIRECKSEKEPDTNGIIIVGDLHGNFHDLCHLIQKYGTPGKNYQFVFNGDFVDRGEKQIETLLTLLYAFIMRPNRVFLNRGNHEDIAMNTSSHFDPNFMTDVRRKYGKYGTAVFNEAVTFFPSLPLATIVENLANLRLFVVHGGISDQTDLNFIKTNLNRHKFQRTSSDADPQSSKQLSDILWSDPIRVEDGVVRPKGARRATGCYFNETRRLGTLFGVDVTESFCKRNGFSWLIRSHEVRENGFSQDHLRCCTIFSASYYCGSSNRGAVIVLPPNSQQFEVYKYRNIGHDMSNLVVKKNHSLIKQFKHLIQLNEATLYPKFQSFDTNRNGYIDESQWATILSEHFKQEISPRHLLALKDFLCECETTKKLVNYRTLFNRRSRSSAFSTNNVENENLLIVIKNLFELLDKNHDNRVSLNEARDALDLINQKVGVNYSAQQQCYNFIKQLDLNGDNVIDLDEFKKAFFEDDSSTGHHHSSSPDGEDTLDSETSEDGDIQIVRL